MNRRKHSPAKLISLGAMVTALSLLCLFASSLLPVGRVPFLFLSSAFICVLTCERAYITAIASYIATSVLAFLILPDKTAAFLYALLLGHYGIFHEVLQERMQGRLFRTVVKLFYCDVFAGVGIYLIYRVFMYSINIPEALPVWALVLIAQAAFIAYDLLYAGSSVIYRSRFQRLIVPRR
ncbi:hypothetical protein LJC27_07925 [Christensenellaceae bacterium OttesenSCG-928-M15]|nr:hypothetical protein [Christensenellaceae bacterium OttesenSCG-928-M15]